MAAPGGGWARRLLVLLALCLVVRQPPRHVPPRGRSFVGSADLRLQRAPIARQLEALRAPHARRASRTRRRPALTSRAAAVALRAGGCPPLVCTTEQGRTLEGLFRAAQAGDAGEDGPGLYRIVNADGAVVAPDEELGQPPFVAVLSNGSVVEVVEVRRLTTVQRVRARLAEPAGWISLENLASGRRWAERAEPFAVFDRRLEDAIRGAGGGAAGAGGPGVEGALAEEVHKRLRGDLLYLSAERAAEAKFAPLLPSFKGPEGRTWALVGEGHENWRNIAAERIHNVRLPPPPDVRSLLLEGRAELQGLVDAYIAKTFPLGLDDLLAKGPYTPFMQRFSAVSSDFSMAGLEMLAKATSDGKSSPEGDAETAEVIMSSPEKSDEEAAEVIKEIMRDETGKAWLPYFTMITDTTSCAQADKYFVHALFGVCLRRLANRFRLGSSLGVLPAPSPDSLRIATKALGDVDDVGDGGRRAALAAQFVEFAEATSRSKEEGGAMDVVLALTPQLLDAIERRKAFLFGDNLRQEVTDRMRLARSANEDNPKLDLLEAMTSLLVEAATSGDLRMLAADEAAQKQLVWDAICFGFFLSEMEDGIGSERLEAA